MSKVQEINESLESLLRSALLKTTDDVQVQDNEVFCPGFGVVAKMSDGQPVIWRRGIMECEEVLSLSDRSEIGKGMDELWIGVANSTHNQ